MNKKSAFNRKHIELEEEIVKILDVAYGLEKNKDGNPHLYVPEVVVIKDGDIINHHLGTLEAHDATKRKMSENERTQLKDFYLKMFKEWGMTKHFVLTVVLLVVSFYFKYFSICYAGIDEAMMWVRVLGNELVFPRYVLVFVLVNLVFPGILVLFFRTIEGDESFWELSYGATSCITVAGFSWHFIYMYPEVDESIACFSVITIAIMIFLFLSICRIPFSSTAPPYNIFFSESG